MIARFAHLAWVAALLALALLTAFAQIDRSSRFAPQLAPLVPTQFRGFAQQRLTELALARADAAAALPLARRLVLVRPLPAENLTLLSQAAVLADDLPTGVAALEAAGERGWREPTAQQAMATSALLTHNWEAASQRIVALMAAGKLEPEQIEPLVVQLTQTADGRAALARRLSESGHWQGNFVPGAPAYLPADVYADVIVRARGLNATLDCGGLQHAATALQHNGANAAVARFWPGECPTG